MDLADCPYRPGTPEWKQWQREALDAEIAQRQEAGAIGATREDKTAAGLADADTKLGYQGARRLDDYPEPWRSDIERRMRTPRWHGPALCPWCNDDFKSDRGVRQHLRRCWSNPDSTKFTSGEYAPSVDYYGRITGYGTTEAGYRAGAARRAKGQAADEFDRDRYGREALAVLARSLPSGCGLREHSALKLARRLEKAGWRLVPIEPSDQS